MAAGWLVGVVAGFLTGCWVLGLRPHWPPREDQDRFLVLLLPAVLVVELLATVPKVPAWLIWLLRLAVAVTAARVLLHDTIYLTDLAGPGSREWTPAQTWLILGGLAAGLAAAWVLLDLLTRRTPSRALPLALALACVGAAVTVMLSGYASGGQLGLPLAAALVGATGASVVLSRPGSMTGAVGFGLVGLFGVLIIGRFFGELSTANALLVFLAPLLCWIAELPYAQRLRPWLRAVTQVALVAVPLVIVIALAQRKFVEESKAPSAVKEPSLQDYLDYGK
jgi:hypothetical protein